MNPYKMAPFTAVILNGGYDLSGAKVTVKAKGEKGIDISYDVSNSQLLTHGKFRYLDFTQIM
ncbi:aryl-sulfate sulfotransferase N-terminal domain-containing protein [Campylobacter fetus]|uniref:aryl-sulfate sulfotransferase N-terminal domain-containing protein n=1 Tax=Campylobacter fetus TaxID=196 RepID=UPI001E4BB23B|nr:aryl-sulfate sulfotransferase N-terminal domain-containing protein [Campylobacter fetus]